MSACVFGALAWHLAGVAKVSPDGEEGRVDE